MSIYVVQYYHYTFWYNYVLPISSTDFAIFAELDHHAIYDNLRSKETYEDWKS